MRITSLAIVTLLAACSIASAGTYFVRPGGSDEADGTSAPAAFRTIVRAAQSLNHGDQIVIAPGTYRESVLIAERFGTPESPVRITGDESGKLTGEKAGEVIIAPADTSSAALHLHRLREAQVSGLTFRGAGEGLKLSWCRGATVERCTFDGLGRGLVGDSTVGLRAESSLFTRCVIGMFLKSCVNTRIANTTIAGSTAAGLAVLSSGQGSLVNSILTNNNTNYVVDEISAPVWSSDHNVIYGNSGPWGKVSPANNVYEWNAASDQERHSVHVVPAFVDPVKYDLHIDAKVTWAGGLPGANVGVVKLDPPVEADRDGKPFRAASAGAYDFPDAQAGEGWKKLAVKFGDGKGPRQSAAIYLEDGSLVRMLLADASGVRDLWWDGRDDVGQPAPAGKYQVRSIAHDVRVVDDGAMGDNGNPMGTYNPDNPERIVVLADGSFVVSTPYDEAGMPLRRFSASGQPVYAANLAEKDFLALAASGQDLIGAIGKDATTKLVRLAPPGERAPMASGAESYPVFAAGEKGQGVGGLAVIGERAFVTLPGLNMIRVIDLKTGQKQADWPLDAVGDIDADTSGQLWAVSGKQIVSLDAGGKPGKRFETGLPTPRYVAVGKDRLAVVDRLAGKLAILDPSNGSILRTFGKDRAMGEWAPVSIDVLRDPRDVAFAPDGRLMLAEGARIRAFWPATGKISHEMLSNFMDTATPHPTKPQYVYCHPGVFEVDEKTGAWRWLTEAPRAMKPSVKEGEPPMSIGGSSHGVVLGGKPFIAYCVQGGQMFLFDVSDPLKPRLALEHEPKAGILNPWAYSTHTFTTNGDLLAAGSNGTLRFLRVPFGGLDASGNPIYDFTKPIPIGSDKDPTPRAMTHVSGITADRASGDIYYLAVTSNYNKMVPAWGADGTGVGKSLPDGTPKWFSLSSGGNYSSIGSVNDGKQMWIFGGKSFGGQMDLFDHEGLRLTTGNWSWPTHFQIGFIDLRYGVQPYVRADGKVGVYVEDDAIGRFARARVDGAETISRKIDAIDWQAGGAPAGGALPLADRTAARGLAQLGSIPKVPALKVEGGDWKQWEDAKVAPQMLGLSGGASFKRNMPPDLMQTFNEGTFIGAAAHDGANFYFYFLATDNTMHFDAKESGIMWAFDGVELWIEEEQFGLAMLADGTPALHKFRHHDKAGAEWKANYALPRENIWATKIADLSTHPLGQRLANIVGTSFSGKQGYAVMAKIPFEEVKLVGGIAGREGTKILPMTGAAGEVLRVGVALGCISAPGREQDYKVNWPSGLMFSDPTRSQPFALEAE